MLLATILWSTEAGPPGDMDRTLEAYTEIAPHYGEYSEKRQAYLDAVDALVIQRLHPSMRLLDIGSGDGRRLKKIMESSGVATAVAVEPSDGMAALCERMVDVPVYRVTVEQLAQLDIDSFDAVTVLWNVFGHLPNSETRKLALQNIAKKMAPGGRLFLDVNNRHNAAAYGWGRVIRRIVVDTLAFDERRGDARYEWKIGDKTFPASGHLFTPKEMDDLLVSAGFVIKERIAVNYSSGKCSSSPFAGQLFYSCYLP